MIDDADDEKNKSDWMFKRCLENAERDFEQKLLGWSFRGINKITTPFPIAQAVDNVIATLKVPAGHFRTPKPQPTGTDARGKDEYGADMTIAMQRLPYGALFTHMREKWEQYAK